MPVKQKATKMTKSKKATKTTKTKVKTTTKKHKKNDLVEKVDILNEKDLINEQIFSSVEFFNENISMYIDKKITINLDLLKKEKDEFSKNYKMILANVSSSEKNIKNKREGFLEIIKKYSKHFIAINEAKVNEENEKVNANHEKKLISLKIKIDKLEAEKSKIFSAKNKYELTTKAKIEEIKAEVSNEHKYSLDSENMEIKKLVKDHADFLKSNVELPLVNLNDEMDILLKEIKDQEAKKMEANYLIIQKWKQNIKTEFKKLNILEKTLIESTIDYLDFLEDVKNFYQDQDRKYKIVLKNAHKIKLATSNKIKRSINGIHGIIASSDKLFDDANLKIAASNIHIQDRTIDQKMLKLKENILGVSGSQPKLLENIFEENTKSEEK